VSKEFRAGSVVPYSGIYRVVHENHRLPHEVILIRGDAFPRCAKCDSAVTFELIQAGSASSLRGAARINELPVLDVEDDPNAQREGK
jgi:hypothetical protein